MARASITDEAEERMVEPGEVPIPLEPTRGGTSVARLVDVSISTDSVVATVTIVTDEPPRRIEVDWGDGDEDVVNHRPGSLVRDAADFVDEPLPEGTYQLHHAYEAPADGLPFEHTLLLRVDDVDGGVDFEIHPITLTPRYRITHYPMTVRLAGPCDPAFQSTSELDVQQVVGGDLVNEWHWEPSNNFFGESQRFRLEGSGLRREFEVPQEVGDVGSETVYFELTETDPDWDDKGTIGAHLTLDSRGYEGYFGDSIEGEVHLADPVFGGCNVVYRYDTEMELLVPLPRSDRVVFSSELFA